MKKIAISIFMVLGILSVFLSGCRAGQDSGGETRDNSSEQAIGTEDKTIKEENIETEEDIKKDSEKEQKPDPETEKQISALPYQFARQYGIIKSEYPVYELDTVVESKLSQGETTAVVSFAICQEQELIISIVLDDYAEADKIAAEEEPSAERGYQKQSDEFAVASEKYQNELWKSGEGLFLRGPGIPEAGIKPQESVYVSYPEYYEAYGHMRYFIEARFEIPSVPDNKNGLSGYELQLLDFEKPLEFILKPTPAYKTLEALVADERGSMDTHDGISIISMGEKVKEGILISWYVYSEAGERPLSLIYKPPFQEIDMPTISNKEKQYRIKQLPANPYWGGMGRYRLSDVKRYGRRYTCLFDVPQIDQSVLLQINIPGITFLNYEESSPITLPIPENYEKLEEDIPWKEGSVRILGITRMKEPQIVEIPDAPLGNKVRERTAVYIDVAAVHENKDLALKGLICQRKLKWSGWEHERYDFDEKGNLSGFRVFYDEGDTEVILKFNGAAFYWNQPFVMELVGP